MGLREAPQLRVAGIPVMQCQALPAGNILVMDRMYTHIRDRRAVEVYWMERMAVTCCPHRAHGTADGGRRCAGHDLSAAPQCQLPDHRGLAGPGGA